MFEAFFNFTHTPFQRDVPPDALYLTPPLKALQDRLSHSVKNRYFLIVTGDSGCGKTTAIRQFIAGLDPMRTVALYVSEANLTPRNFYFDVLNQLGIKPHFYRGDAKRQLMKEILIHSADHKLPVIIIDEAHLCNMEMLTEIRFLLNFNMDSHSPMALILVGQSEIRDILKKQVYEAISQRIDLRCHIPPLDHAQTTEYIAAHLHYAAGSPSEIFTGAAISAIFDFSAGLPRKINRLATLCLMHAAQTNKRFIDDHMVSLIIDGELSW
ncbi:MAG: AAA family ATPase [Clostridia bacterium]|nr:AAA family ATPase [Clostridia bacterium]